MAMDLKVLQNDISKINSDLLALLDKRSALIKKFNADNARKQRSSSRLGKQEGNSDVDADADTANDHEADDKNGNVAEGSDSSKPKVVGRITKMASVDVSFDATLNAAVEKYSGSYTAAQMKTIVDAIDKATEALSNKGVVVGFLESHKDSYKTISQKGFNYVVEADFSYDGDELIDKLANGEVDYAVMPTVTDGAYYHAALMEYLVEPNLTILKEVNIYDRNSGHSGFLVLGSRPADAKQTLIVADGSGGNARRQQNRRGRGGRGRGRGGNGGNGNTISPTAPNPYKSLILAFSVVPPQAIERVIALLEGAGITMEELHSVKLASGNYFYMKCKPSRQVTNIGFVEDNLGAITTSLRIYAI